MKTDMRGTKAEGLMPFAELRPFLSGYVPALDGFRGVRHGGGHDLPFLPVATLDPSHSRR